MKFGLFLQFLFAKLLLGKSCNRSNRWTKAEADFVRGGESPPVKSPLRTKFAADFFIKVRGRQSASMRWIQSDPPSPLVSAVEFFVRQLLFLVDIEADPLGSD